MDRADSLTWERGGANSGEDIVVAVSEVGVMERKWEREADRDCKGREVDGRFRWERRFM
jgi:hypothetical protein